MSKDVKIEKIVFKMGKKTIELSMDEAEKLQGLLNDTFGDKEYIPWPVIRERIWEPCRPYYYDPWQITYTTADANSAGVLTCSCENFG